MTNHLFINILYIKNMPNNPEKLVQDLILFYVKKFFISCLVGALLGFLWFNSNPAQIFMGDAGSIPLGGTLGIIAILIKQEFLLIIIGGVFVIEAFSVILQILSFRLFKKRIFLI